MTNRTLFRILITIADILQPKIVMTFRVCLNKPTTCAEILKGSDKLLKFLNYQMR